MGIVESTITVGLILTLMAGPGILDFNYNIPFLTGYVFKQIDFWMLKILLSNNYWALGIFVTLVFLVLKRLLSIDFRMLKRLL